MKTKLLILSAVLAVGLVIFLVRFSGPGSEAAEQGKVRVTTTVMMITDMVREIGGERVAVAGMMGPGVDPHLYKATASDVAKLRRADVIFYNGLYLEGRMQEMFNQMSRTHQHVYAVTDSVPVERLLSPEEFAGQHDPHVWFDVELWAECIATVVNGLSAVDAEGREYYEQRGELLRERLLELHQWVLEKAAEVPEESRILVTSHDAFNYFGRAYGFQVVALQGISTATEASLADVVNLVDFIKKHRLKAIFVETSVPPQTIRRISQDAGVKVGGELFSDAMGTPGTIVDGYDLGTYEGMIKHNMNTIVEALR